MENSTPNCWTFKSVVKTEQTYVSIEGYNDVLTEKYNYDNSVANHKQVKEGDYAILINKKEILGLAKIKLITTEKGTKIRRRCPECGSTSYESRKILVPKYRCNKGHEFIEPITEIVNIIKYKANYKNFFLKVDHFIPVRELKPYFINNYNRNMSIQKLDKQVLEKLLPKEANLFLNQKFSLVNKEQKKFSDEILEYEVSIKSKLKKQYNRTDRKGQNLFREKLRIRYGDLCMVSGSRVIEAIQAAHIVPYSTESDNHSQNGLLLRADIHILFDAGLIKIEPESLTIIISNRLKGSSYEKYDRQKLILNNSFSPSKTALDFKWKNLDE